MKKFLQTLPVAVAAAFIALSANANAQTVEINGLGSSALFLEAGLGASDNHGQIKAQCVWTTKSDLARTSWSQLTPALVPH